MTTRIPTVIRVGSAPPRFNANGTYFDGETAEAHPVHLSIDEDRGALKLDSGDGSPGFWSLDQIRSLPDQAGRDQLVLCHAEDPLARLVTTEHLLEKRCPHLNRRVRTASRSRLMAWAVAALASVALIILVLVPRMADQLAEFLPPEGERALGETTLNQIRNALSGSEVNPVASCDNADGRAALVAMQRRLTWKKAEQRTDVPPLSVHVLDHDMVNAFALPGGFVVLFRGLIDAAETPEELAAVFAHEMGHVVSRDPTRHALRSAGSIGVLGLIFGDFAGGAIVLFLAEQLIEAQYSQDAEAEADRFAQEMLLEAGIPPSALGDMFEHLLKIYGGTEGVMAHFLSHPDLESRIAAARAATPVGFTGQRILSTPEWQALKKICR